MILIKIWPPSDNILIEKYLVSMGIQTSDLQLFRHAWHQVIFAAFLAFQPNLLLFSLQIFVMNNYFGIGLDADLCYAFHTEREHKPHKFNSRLHNKTVYVKVSLQKMVGRGLSKDLRKDVLLEVDGKVIDLPNIKGIIILNIMR